jgi:hypothetical protein
MKSARAVVELVLTRLIGLVGAVNGFSEKNPEAIGREDRIFKTESNTIEAV